MKKSNELQRQEEFWKFEKKYWMDYFQGSENGLPGKRVNQFSLRPPASSNHVKLQRIFFLFFRQFKSPLMLLLAVAVSLSLFLGDRPGGFIMFVILFASGTLSFFQERNAGKIVNKLQALLSLKSMVIRSGTLIQISSSDILPGDILMLKAGDMIPADCLLIETNELHVNESALTGESYPVRKAEGIKEAGTKLSERSNAVWQGTNIVSGSAQAIAINTGSNTEMGELNKRTLTGVETSFETGITAFGYFLMKITLVLALLVFLINLGSGRDIIDTVIFSLALAVGMAPELLPAITTIAMSDGAKRMLRKKVIVKKLSAIQNLGEVNMLCSDKTGTVTEGIMRIAHFYDINGEENEFVKKIAILNAVFETGYNNPIDKALKEFSDDKIIAEVVKIAEIPYDFTRKRLSVALEIHGERILTTKGSFYQVKEICSQILVHGIVVPISGYIDKVDIMFKEFGLEGYRVIAVCYKHYNDEAVTAATEISMIFAGFVLMNDSVKPGITDAIKELNFLGVGLKIITGDNKDIANSTARALNMSEPRIVTGKDLDHISSSALEILAPGIDIFAEVEPLQKERIVAALKKTYTVAYLGDGINDIAAIHEADIGISVSNAVDIAREAADLVLMDKDLTVLAEGIREGRKTFANTLKYIHISTGSTFGNMCTVAMASLFLPFLPMLPKQILFTNFITDFPYLAVASDKVDEGELRKPGKWSIKRVQSYMLFFGIHSTVFDMITFFVLLFIFHADERTFQTGWLIISVVSELCILFVIRTKKGLFHSRPSVALLVLSGGAIFFTVLTPYIPLGNFIGLAALPARILPILLMIIVAYVSTAGMLKKWFYRRYDL